MKKNLEIREKLNDKGIKMWQLADRLGISPSTLCIKLRYEVNEEAKKVLLYIIDELAGNLEDEEYKYKEENYEIFSKRNN